MGAITPPEELKHFPLHTLVIPAARVLEASARPFVSTLSSDRLQSIVRSGRPTVIEGGPIPVLIIMPEGTGHTAGVEALRIAAQRGSSSVAFFQLLGLTAGGLLAFQKDNPPAPPAEILLPFKEATAMGRFFADLRAGDSSQRRSTDPYATEVKDYLDERSQPSLQSPSLIPPYTTVAKKPLHTIEPTDMGDLQPADLRQPQRGFVRLVSDSLLDRALAMVPEQIRTAEKDSPPPVLFARLTATQPRNVRTVSHQQRDPSLLTNHVLTSECMFSITQQTTGRESLIGEIGLFDLPREVVAHSDDLGHYIFASFLPLETAKFFYKISRFEIVPEPVYRRVVRDAKGIGEGIVFSKAECDLVLLHQILHECAEILWHVLPAGIRTRWAQLFPLEGNRDTSSIYFRNLLRIYTEGDTASPEEFFASETFADALAFHWATEISQFHQLLNGDTIRRHRDFFEEVMKWAARRRGERGSVFNLTV